MLTVKRITDCWKGGKGQVYYAGFCQFKAYQNGKMTPEFRSIILDANAQSYLSFEEAISHLLNIWRESIQAFL